MIGEESDGQATDSAWPVQDRLAMAGDDTVSQETDNPKGPTGSRFAWLTGSGMAAVVTWLLATPLAFVAPTVSERNPFTSGAVMIPLAVAFALAVILFTVTVWWSHEVVAGAAAGLSAAWVVLMFRLALDGTPFGFGGLTGDMSRMSATVTRYSVTAVSSDTLNPNLPSEYPPFYSWLVGRASVLFDVPAWQLLGDAEVLFTSAALLAGFLLWRRQISSWLALAITVLTTITWSDPRKAFEMFTLAIFVPWALEVFTRPPSRRMHWFPAGVLGGVIVMTYQAWMVYAALGIVALIVIGWRTEPDRWAYLRRIALVAAVSFVVASWYVVPFLWASLTMGGQQVSDLYVSDGINGEMFPFLDPEPLGVLQLIGLVGTAWLYRSVWWARPLLLLIVGTYLYRLLAMLRFIVTDHTLFMHYSARLYGVLLTTAGVLVVAHVTPLVLDRLRVVPPRRLAAAALAVTMAWSAWVFTETWMPGRDGQFTAAAHTEPLPGGGYPRYAPEEGRRPWIPVYEVRQIVEGQLGRDAQPITLSDDDRIFAYFPWQSFIGTDRTAGATLSRWDDRRAVLDRLMATSDPAEFVGRSADTGFGSIDVFVLRADKRGWIWSKGAFRPEQFDSRYWTVKRLPNDNDIVVAVRR